MSSFRRIVCATRWTVSWEYVGMLQKEVVDYRLDYVDDSPS